jgi:hypothetical protein
MAKQEVCIQIDKSLEKNLSRKIEEKYRLPNSIASKMAKRKLLFAREYFNYINEKDMANITLLVLNYLEGQYIKQLIKKNLPTEKEMYSYYLLHKDKYPNGFQKEKNKIEKEMVHLKLPSLISEETKRLMEKK